MEGSGQAAEAVLITGASNGIGLATLKALRTGNRTVINLDLAAPKEDVGGLYRRVDLGNEAETAEALSEICSHYRVVQLVNNVGWATRTPVEEVESDELLKSFHINLRSAIQCTQAVLPAMKAAGSGRIVNISSRAALGKERRTSYAAMKGGLISLTRVWALELAPYNITVNAIAPGTIATDIYRAVNPADSPQTKKLLDGIPLKRVGEPEEVAHAVAFVLSEQSSYITGQVLYVCGGLSVGASRV
jgi:3-oxoacyl-[acyl-carrier protein] reductase